MEKLENVNGINEELICPTCLSFQSISRGEDILGKCQNPICNEIFMFLKCYHCKKRIYFTKQNFTNGVNIKCPYVECEKWFCKSACGACERILYFPDRYQEGSKVKCPFKDCQEEYSKIICPNEKCGIALTFKIPKENLSLTPLSQNSNVNLSQLNNNTYREGLSVNCKNCNLKFQKINCYHCLRRLVWAFPNNLIEGQKIICPYENCKKHFNKVDCFIV